jgi:predicted enzyme related to lactoylglutathione lyase
MSFSSTPLQGKVIWNDLITEDIDASRRFYGEMFGWTFEAASGPGRQDYVREKSGDSYVAGFAPIDRPADDNRLSRWLPYLSVSDVDESVAAGIAAGATVAVAARNVSLGRVAAIIDPEGAVIGVARRNIGDPDDMTTAGGPGRAVWTEVLSNDSDVAATFYKSIVGLSVGIPVGTHGFMSVGSSRWY